MKRLALGLIHLLSYQPPERRPAYSAGRSRRRLGALPGLLILALGLTACFPVIGRVVSVTAVAVVVTVVIPTPTPVRVTPALPPTARPPTATPIALPSPAPAHPESYVLQLVAVGFNRPVALTHAADGTGRLFVVEQNGLIRILHNGIILPEPFLDLTGIAVASASERGLLGLAFSPQYAANGQFFVNYTDVNGDTAIARYTVSADPNRADPSSGQIILRVPQPYANHNGGDIAFGPDGYLYIGTGDGGSAGDPQNNGQRLDTLLGKMLRVDVSAEPYAIPASNPFADTTNARPQIWAYGLRNPWRFSFDRATGDLYIADVGQGEWEEVNYQSAASTGGENYGWNIVEGSHAYAGGAQAGLTMPIAEYSHAEGGCAVTGGYVYRGPSWPGLQGAYVFGDYCTGKTWKLTRAPDGTWTRAPFLETGLNLSAFGEDEAGELYVIDHNGAVYQLSAAQ